jgi:predicted acyltransferase
MIPLMPSASNRVLSVDVLRGLTIALMILVNDPGDWSHTYSQLDHAPWNGFTLTDFVFPNFLFLVGASIVFSLQSRIARGESKRTLALHMFRRALTLFAIKMFLSAFPHFHLTHLRLYGVLTRIALCYLAAGLLCLAVWNTRYRARTLLGITAALLVGYWILMRFVPVPGLGLASLHDAIPTHAIPILDPDRNLAAWLDRGVNAFTQRWLHTGSLYNQTRDPEGLLSTLPAIATTLIGCITALWLRRPVPLIPSLSLVALPPAWMPQKTFQQQTMSGLILASLGCQLVGHVWNYTFPINKNLWTSSYVFFAASLSICLLALCYRLIDTRRLSDNLKGNWFLRPWLIFGSNAITAYVVSDFLVELTLWIKVPAGSLINPTDPSQRISGWLWTYRHLFARHNSTEITSLAFAVAFTALCFIPNWLLWRRKIFLKI